MRSLNPKSLFRPAYKAARLGLRVVLQTVGAGAIRIKDESSRSPFSALLFLATVVYTCFAAFQWQVMKGQLAEMHSASTQFVASNGAFIYFDKVNFHVVDSVLSNPPCCLFNLPQTTGKAVLVTLTLVNAGNVAAQQVRVVTNCYPVGPPRQPRDPFSAFRWSDKLAYEQVIGPKQAIEIDACQLSPEELLNAQMGIVHRYFLAEVRYRDPLDPGTIHRTELSRELIVTDVGGASLSGFSADTIARGHHNCADDECE